MGISQPNFELNLEVVRKDFDYREKEQEFVGLTFIVPHIQQLKKKQWAVTFNDKRFQNAADSF